MTRTNRSLSRTLSLVPTTTERTRPSVIVSAPALGTVVDVLLAVKAHPEDKRAQIQRGLLARSRADRCPACQSVLSLDGYAHTRTEALDRETLACSGCALVYVVRERMTA